MKYKKLTKEQIIISLDRLTRFKNTKDKYLRVFSEILSSNLTEPKLKKDEILNLDYSILAEYVSEIFNNSLESISNDYSINQKLKEYENKVFKNDKETQKLLNNKIDYKSALAYINEDSPINLKWLICLNKTNNYNALRELRKKNATKFPVELVIISEGITEETLIPAFAKYLNYDFYENGIQIIGAGGKNQVVKMYYELSEYLEIPIFVLLDKDAEENRKQIEPRLRKTDKIHLVSCGEFEDLLPKSLIVKTVNNLFKNFIEISEEDFDRNEPTAKILEEIYKTRGLHEFKKADFSKSVRANINEKSDVSEEIVAIIEELNNINKLT